MVNGNEVELEAIRGDRRAYTFACTSSKQCRCHTLKMRHHGECTKLSLFVFYTDDAFVIRNGFIANKIIPRHQHILMWLGLNFSPQNLDRAGPRH